MEISHSPANDKANLITCFFGYGKIVFLFYCAEAKVLDENYPFGLIKLNKLSKAFSEDGKRLRIIHSQI
jgi:hypothetical protein